MASVIAQLTKGTKFLNKSAFRDIDTNYGGKFKNNKKIIKIDALGLIHSKFKTFIK